MARPKKDEVARQVISSRIDVALFFDLKHRAVDEGRGVYEIIEESLRTYLISKGVVLSKQIKLKG